MRAAGRLARGLLVAAFTLLGLTAILVLFERHLIYFPFRQLELQPRDLGLASEEALLVAEDGVRIHGWFLPRPDAAFTVLMCHGNAGNISHRLDRALLIQTKLGAGVFLFDYRGYGRSEGSPEEEGTYRDARAAYGHLTGRLGIPSEKVILFGESLGAAVAVQIALERPARALVLESAFASVPEMARVIYPFLPLGPFVRTRYDNLAKVAGLHMPLLMLHGQRDDIVPFAQGRRVFEAAPEPKRFFAIPGAGHNDTYVMGGEGYWRAWREFLAGLARDVGVARAEP